jgi:E2F/DP family winged-helix DNA-binding domain
MMLVNNSSPSKIHRISGSSINSISAGSIHETASISPSTRNQARSTNATNADVLQQSIFSPRSTAAMALSSISQTFNAGGTEQSRTSESSDERKEKDSNVTMTQQLPPPQSLFPPSSTRDENDNLPFLPPVSTYPRTNAVAPQSLMKQNRSPSEPPPFLHNGRYQHKPCATSSSPQPIPMNYRASSDVYHNPCDNNLQPEAQVHSHVQQTTRNKATADVNHPNDVQSQARTSQVNPYPYANNGASHLSSQQRQHQSFGDNQKPSAVVPAAPTTWSTPYHPPSRAISNSKDYQFTPSHSVHDHGKVIHSAGNTRDNLRSGATPMNRTSRSHSGSNSHNVTQQPIDPALYHRTVSWSNSEPQWTSFNGYNYPPVRIFVSVHPIEFLFVSHTDWSALIWIYRQSYPYPMYPPPHYYHPLPIGSTSGSFGTVLTVGHNQMQPYVTPTPHKKQKLANSNANFAATEQYQFLPQLPLSTYRASSAAVAEAVAVPLETSKPEEKYNRKNKSLGVLAESFLKHFTETSGCNEIIIDELSESLSVERRRIYDVVNILEALQVVVKMGKNTYLWMGREHLVRQFALLQQSGIEQWPEHAANAGLCNSPTNSDTKSIGMSSTEVKVDVSASDQKDNSNKSLTRLSQLFLQVFLIGVDPVSLPQASELIHGGQMSPDELVALGLKPGEAFPTDAKTFQQVKARGLKTKIRRLYDIANVFLSVGLLRKSENRTAASTEGKRPLYHFQYHLTVHAIRDVYKTLPLHMANNGSPFNDQQRTLLRNSRTDHQPTNFFGAPSEMPLHTKIETAVTVTTNLPVNATSPSSSDSTEALLSATESPMIASSSTVTIASTSIVHNDVEENRAKQGSVAEDGNDLPTIMSSSPLDVRSSVSENHAASGSNNICPSSANDHCCLNDIHIVGGGAGSNNPASPSVATSAVLSPSLSLDLSPRRVSLSTIKSEPEEATV